MNWLLPWLPIPFNNRPKGTMEPMNRRQFVAAGTAAAVLLASNTATAASHDHGHMSMEMKKNETLIDAALDCVKEGELCVAHCIVTLKDGDTKLAKCLETAQAAVEACQLLSSYAAGNSKHLKALAKLCIDVCGDCSKECEKHAKKHPSCKACMESCDQCIKACKKVA